MLTNLEVFTFGISTPPINIVDQPAALDLIQIRNIDGLGPVKATVNSTQYGSIDGEAYDGSVVPKRNIVLTVGINPDWASLSIEAVRQILYGYFLPENQVRLRFSSTHMPRVEILGYVESFEPNIFSREAEYQISIICPQPYFVAVDQTVLTGITSDISAAVDELVDYQGNIDTGFVLDFETVGGSLPGGATSFTNEVRLINKIPGVQLLIANPVTINSAQYFSVSTVDGDKYAHYVSYAPGLPANVLQKIMPGSIWSKLHKGVNTMQFTSTDPGLHWTLTYYARYGGL